MINIKFDVFWFFHELPETVVIRSLTQRSQIPIPSKHPLAKNLSSRLAHKHVVHENAENGSSMVRFPLVIADSEHYMPGIKPGPLGVYTSALTTGL
jgi:hypothetical protein